MKAKRLNLETNQIEEVEVIGRVKFVGSAPKHDLTSGRIYDCIGIRNNLLMLLDDSKDYYLYLPQDGNKILRGEAAGAGFVIVEDDQGMLAEVFAIQHEKLIKGEKSLLSKLVKGIIDHGQHSKNKKNK